MGQIESPEFPTADELEKSYTPPTDSEIALQEYQLKMKEKERKVREQGIDQLNKTISDEFELIDLSPDFQVSWKMISRSTLDHNLAQYVSWSHDYYIEKRIAFSRKLWTPKELGETRVKIEFQEDHISMSINSNVRGFRKIEISDIEIKHLSDIRDAINQYLDYVRQGSV